MSQKITSGARAQIYGTPYLKTVSDLFNGLPVSADRFIDPTKVAAIRDRSSAYNATADLQKAVYACMYESAAGELVIPSGLYNLDDALQVGYGTDFRQLKIRGAGGAYRGMATMGGTVLRSRVSDRPAVVVQGGRAVVLQGLSVIGQAGDYISTRDLGGMTSAIDDTSVAAWLDPALNANAASRYAPYAGIAVDPYVGIAPNPAYPAVPYPAALGAVAQYGKGRTDSLTVEDCYISGFVVGAAIQPCNDDGNGDFIAFRNTMFEFLAYGISAGNAQGRNVNLDTVKFRNLHTALTNNKHGKQVGKFGGHIRGCEFDRLIQIFDLDGGQCGPMVFDGCYSELLWKFGTESAPTRQYPITFQGGEFNLHNHPAKRGVPSRIADGMITMRGVSLGLPSLATAAGVKFEAGCKVENFDMTTGPAPSAARTAAQQGTCGIMPLGVSLPTDSSTDLSYVVSAGTVRRGLPIANGAGRSLPFNRIARQMRVGDNAQALPASNVPYGWSGVKAKASIPAVFNGITGTLDFTNLYAAVFPYGIAAGDVVQCDATGTLFLVDSMAGMVASVTALNNYYDIGAGKVFRDAINTGAGNWYVLSPRIYGTTAPNFGTITAGSPTITAIGRADAYAGTAGADLAVGDYLWQHDWTGKYFPAGAKITAIDTAARTITMSANATKAGVDIPLNVWVRP